MVLELNFYYYFSYILVYQIYQLTMVMQTLMIFYLFLNHFLNF